MLTRSKLPTIVSLLACPDDGADVVVIDDGVQCSRCRRIFKVYDNDIIEMMPSTMHTRSLYNDKYPAVVNRYWRSYTELFNEKYRRETTGAAWGAFESITHKNKMRKKKELLIINGLMGKTKGILCDVSAGAGLVTIPSCKRFDIVINCDISVNNLNYVYNKAKTEMIENIVFIRCDHLNLPIKKDSIAVAVAIDTLIYGREHDVRLLNEMRRIIGSGGFSIIDISNKYHKLPFIDRPCYRYTMSEIKRVIKECGYENFISKRFVQETDTLFRALIPATRFVMKMIKTASS
ncbi:MAG: methyltransferase domain-containing protein [Candidatus Omnitrophica bacterium]|nr:methyltransferase domain-containing protein [Candidatus Omnitrophota bacterium]